jgi:hypothetical protein
MKFFYTWYRFLNQETKDNVKKLMKNGQLEITQGGWVSTDEACTNYQDMIMNMYIGHNWLQNEFGVTPRIGWMVDSFGHSTTNAALFADFGFDAIFLSREPSDSKNKRADDGEFAFVWKPFSNHFGN